MCVSSKTKEDSNVSHGEIQLPEDIVPVLPTLNEGSFVPGRCLTVPTLFCETLPARCCTGSSRSRSLWWWKLQVRCDTERVSASFCCHLAVLQRAQQTHIVLLDFTTTTTTVAAGYVLTRRGREDSGSLSIFNADQTILPPALCSWLRQHCWCHLTKAEASSRFFKLLCVNKVGASLQ